MMCMGAKAQSGICVDNRRNACGVFVKMFAMDPAGGYPLGSINSVTFYVPAGVINCWNTVLTFQSGVGWITPTTILSSTTTFNWTDVSFQFDCPECAGGGGMSNPCSPNVFGGAPVWSSSCHSATWLPVCLAPLGNLTLTFN